MALVPCAAVSGLAAYGPNHRAYHGLATGSARKGQQFRVGRGQYQATFGVAGDPSHGKCGPGSDHGHPAIFEPAAGLDD